MGLKGNTVAEQIWNYWKSKGLSNYAVAGLMGNLFAESGLRADNLQDSGEKKLNMSDTEYTRAVDNGTYQNFVRDSIGYGIAQWTYWNRKQNLLNFATQRKKSIGDLETQLDFLYSELQSGYRATWNGLLKAKTILDASNEVLTKFEKPKDQGTSVQNARAKYGQEYYNKFVKGENTMGVIIGSARINEKGTINGGVAGDQNGGEVSTQAWYLHSKGWIVIRPKDSTVAEKIAKNMQAMCDNNNIGYCQDHRSSLTVEAKKYAYDVSKVTKKCEVDCSEGVRICVMYAGITVGAMTTANAVSLLEKTGKFEIIRGDEYCKSDKKLKRGDILCTKTKGHVVVVLSNGSESTPKPTTQTSTTAASGTKVVAAKSKDAKLGGTYVTTTSLRLRAVPGTGNNTTILILASGSEVQNYGYYTDVDGTRWLYVSYKGTVGYCSMKYLKKK